MSVQSVTPTNRQAINQQMEANLRAATSGGLSTVGSSISSATGTTSAAPAATSGFCATISAWVSSVVEGIRNCCAKIPLIGPCFEPSGSVSSTQPASSTVVDPLALADINFVTIIKAIYKQPPAAATTGSAATGPVYVPPAVPAGDLQTFSMDQFNAIQTPAAKWEALANVLSASNSTDAIGRQYYQALTPAMQDQFRGEMYRHNCGSVFPAPPATGGVDYGFGFGGHMAYHQIRSPLAIQAARNLHANPIVTP